MFVEIEYHRTIANNSNNKHVEELTKKKQQRLKQRERPMLDVRHENVYYKIQL